MSSSVRRFLPIFIFLSAVCLGSVVVRANRARARFESKAELKAKTPTVSNEGGYLGSNACIACHPGEHQSWHDSYHRTMTQVATRETVLGDFNDVDLDYFGLECHLTTDGDQFWIEMEGKKMRVVQTTGAHHYQVYWLPGQDGILRGFPMAYLVDEQRWISRNDLFMTPPEMTARPEATNSWNYKCIKCHSTHGQPKLDPVEKRANTTVAELGIACESCHGPGKAHVEQYSDPTQRYGRYLTGDGDTKIVNPANCSHETGSQICGQCHSITRSKDRGRWFREGFLYRPGDDLDKYRHTVRPGVYPPKTPKGYFDKFFWSDGMCRISGREYNGLIESPCYQRGEMSCMSCHSMHDSDPVDQISPEMTGNYACLQCHSEMSSDIEAHTHHTATSSGSQCYNCHMPHTSSGLVKALRSHQVSSPNVGSTVTTGRPHACNLCHLDKTLEWTSEYVADWYGEITPPLSEEHRTVSAALLDLLQGDASQRALIAWHAGWKPAHAASGNDWLAPFVATALADEYPVVRSIAYRSLQKLPGFESFEYDFASDADDHAEKADEVRKLWQSGEPTRKGTECLMDESGKLLDKTMGDLMQRRDNTPIFLHE